MILVLFCISVTRLRRRLSVEQTDDTKSPVAPSTPTKKRGRLATKPLLDNIDENGNFKFSLLLKLQSVHANC